MPYWEDTQPRISPDGTTVAYGQEGDVWLVPVTGGVPRRLVEGGGPVWLDDARLLVSIEHERDRAHDPHDRRDVADPLPRRLARDHDDLDALGDEGGPTVSPDGAEVAYVFVPRDDLKRAEIRVVDIVTGARARAHRHARHGRHRPRLVARRRDGRLRLRAPGPPRGPCRRPRG